MILVKHFTRSRENFGIRSEVKARSGRCRVTQRSPHQQIAVWSPLIRTVVPALGKSVFLGQRPREDHGQLLCRKGLRLGQRPLSLHRRHQHAEALYQHHDFSRRAGLLYSCRAAAICPHRSPGPSRSQNELNNTNTAIRAADRLGVCSQVEQKCATKKPVQGTGYIRK